MHEHYMKNRNKLKKGMHKFFVFVTPELERAGKKKYNEIFDEIWDYYEKNLLEHFPYVGGDKVSGTKKF